MSRYLSSISEERPYLLKFIVNLEDGNLTVGSSKKIEWKCDGCGTHFYRSVCCVVKRGFSCPECGENTSFPNKLMRKILQSLGIKNEPEKTFCWARSENNKLLPYDFYIEDESLIIEMMGGQHKRPIKRFGGTTGLLDRQKIDANKEIFAKQNGIKNYIKIDCDKDDFDSILFEIFKSKLNDIFDLNKLDKLELEKSFFINEEFLMCINEFNTRPRLIGTLSKDLHIHYRKVKRYIELGAKLGICDYSEGKVKIIGKEHRLEYCVKFPVVQYDVSGDFVKEYKSAKEAEIKNGLSNGKVSSVCRGDTLTAGGFIWRYKNKKYSKTIEEYVGDSIEKRMKSTKKKEIIQYSKMGDAIHKFSSIANARRETGIKGISNCLCGRSNTAGHYVWKYAE